MKCTTLLATMLALAAGLPAAARADDASLAETSPRIRQEWLGVEVPAGVYATSTSGQHVLFPDADVPRATGGLGLVLRLGRHRWERVYWTPLQVGVFDGRKGAEVQVWFAQTELGLSLWNRGGHSVDVGLAAGMGSLGVRAGTGCDGACALGGAPFVVAPVVRYSHTWGSRASAGVSLRLLRGVADNRTTIGYVADTTNLIMLAAELALGSS